jgi:hypothetical protein
MKGANRMTQQEATRIYNVRLKLINHAYKRGTMSALETAHRISELTEYYRLTLDSIAQLDQQLQPTHHSRGSK